MSTTYPLVGYHFAILDGDVIAVTGRIVQGNGGNGYLVRFEGNPPYCRVYPFDDAFFSGVNLFSTEEELGDFVEFVHKTLPFTGKVASANDVPELPEDPEVEDPEPTAA